MQSQMENPETQNQWLEPTGQQKHCKTHGLTGAGPGVARKDAVYRVFGHFLNRSKPYLRTETTLLAGDPNQLLTLAKRAPRFHHTVIMWT